MTLTGGGVLVQRGLMRGPELNLEAFGYHLVAKTTNRPECMGVPQQECFTLFPIPLATPRLRYAVWVGTIEQIDAPNSNTANVTIRQGRLILDLLLRR